VILTPGAASKPPARLGGKATSWWRMAAAGLPVPLGFCIPADEAVEPAALSAALTVLRERTGAVTVAVRSSGIGEDGLAQSFAGLFESILDVPIDERAVAKAIDRCRAAGSTARVRSATGGTVPVGVLIQEMIHPVRSGVLFTRDPRRAHDGMVVEVVDGHLRGLVDGTRDAQRVCLGTDLADRVLDLQERSELLRLGAQIEALIDGPADIEWASRDGRVFILQARAITSLDRDGTTGLELVPVTPKLSHRLPRAVLQHDKIALRLAAAELAIGISNGFVALATAPTPEQVSARAADIAHWDEFIAVLLDPFYLDGQILRCFGTGRSADADLRSFVERVGRRHHRFAFLLKELQETAATGVAVRLADGGVRIEAIAGHFFTKGFASPAVYHLNHVGACIAHQEGRQDFAFDLRHGKKERVPVSGPPSIPPPQLAVVFRATQALAQRYAGAGIEFGFTPSGQFFLVDLYQSKAVAPPDREAVLSEGRVVGTVRVLDLPDDAAEESVERHVHSRTGQLGQLMQEPRVIVVRRPLHVLDRLIYEAEPGTIGFVCEGGALLCHLAVVMRERGAPGLVLADATKTLVEGERVVLDTRPGSPSFITRL